MTHAPSALATVALLLATFGCTTSRPRHDSATPDVALERIATSARQWTGIAVTDGGRVFVNFPRWSDDVPVSVAELVDGEPVPFPDARWNAWAPGDDPTTHFVCVQAMFVDDLGALWILDPASPRFEGVVEGGAKLMRFDSATGALVRTYRFGPEVAPADSYLNDVRIDRNRDVAYLTDSGAGALVVVDLASGAARRLLDDHPSTSAEDVTLTIGGRPWLGSGGVPPRVHADGIAYDRPGDWVYFQALTGRTLYALSGAALRDSSLGDDDLAARIVTVGATGASDGLLCGPQGRIYLTSLEHDAIRRATADGRVETVVADPAIAWPDSMAWGLDGMLYFTVARIHEGESPTEPYAVYRVRILDFGDG